MAVATNGRSMAIVPVELEADHEQPGVMRNYGAATPVYCDACEARIRPTTLDYKLRHADNSSHEDRECGDLAYEDRCADACGPGL